MTPPLKSDWCKHGALSENDIFKDNGECTCGIYGHHYHCNKCGGVTQVG